MFNLTVLAQVSTFSAMKRLAIVCFSLVLLWTLAPGMGELVENGAHFLAEQHLAHDAADGDEHAPLDPEHGCTDTAHLCSCHVSHKFLAAALFNHSAHTRRTSMPAPTAIQAPQTLGGGIDHPPKA